MDFQKGDVVQLKSGGPYMTVVNPSTGTEKDLVYVIWFPSGDESGVKAQQFVPEVLVKKK